jgi:hypothetical protein
MKGKSALMSGVAAVALVAFAQAGYAQKSGSDSMSNSSPAPMAQPAQSGPTNEELSARIDALEAELQQSEVREAADHDAIAGWQPSSGWWDNTSISGRMYFDFSDITNKNNGTANVQDGDHFDVKRFYIGIDHKFDDVWSANVTTDFTYDTSQCDGVTAGPPASCSSTGASATQLYIKKAYLQGKFADWFVVRAGAFDMPWIPFAEDAYGYRYVENTLIDRLKLGNSADWGFNVSGAFGDDLKFEYSLAAINGAGYKKPGFGLGTNRSKGMDFEGRVDVKYEGFIVAVGGYSGTLGKDLGGTTPTPAYHTYQRFDVLAAYVANGFHVGVEYFTENSFNDITTSTTGITDSGNGVSGFASYQFTPEWALFGRYDSDSPTDGTAKNQPKYNNDYYNVGIEWTPTKIVNLALVYKHDAGSDGQYTDSNGAIGGSSGGGTGNTTKGAYNEFGLFGQLRW